MNDDNITINEEQAKGFTVLRLTEQSKWKCYLFGGSVDGLGLVWIPNKGCEPNWFWRKMQYLILGNLWVKTE
jgi:hypothetical protein